MIDWLLDKVRGAVYRMGFEPTFGTILYSPSRAWRKHGAEFWEGWKRGEAIARGEAVDTRTPEEKAESWARIERIASWYDTDDDEETR